MLVLSTSTTMGMTWKVENSFNQTGWKLTRCKEGVTTRAAGQHRMLWSACPQSWWCRSPRSSWYTCPQWSTATFLLNNVTYLYISVLCISILHIYIFYILHTSLLPVMAGPFCFFYQMGNTRGKKNCNSTLDFLLNLMPYNWPFKVIMAFVLIIYL